MSEQKRYWLPASLGGHECVDGCICRRRSATTVSRSLMWGRHHRPQIHAD